MVFVMQSVFATQSGTVIQMGFWSWMAYAMGIRRELEPAICLEIPHHSMCM
jgi:hypothetical protein